MSVRPVVRYLLAAMAVVSGAVVSGQGAAASVPGSASPRSGQVAELTTGNRYVALTPARLYDSRPGTSTVDGIGVGAGAQGPNSVRTVQVLGRGGVPATGVEAVVLHLTSAQATAQTYVSAWASDQPQPVTSVFNPGPSGPDSNLVVVPVGPSGTVSLFNSVGSLHLIVDVQGWFPTGSSYEASGPARVFDTRQTGTPLGADRAVDVPVVGVGGVPATGVGSVVMNVTAVDPTEPSYLTVHAAGTPRPDTSNLNTRPGRVSANLVVAEPGADGKVSIYNRSGSTQLIVDVLGWFADGSDYVPLTPSRVLDTRGSGPIGPGATIRLPLAGRAGIPPTGAGTVVVNLTAPSATNLTYLTVYPTGMPRPVASDLNPRPGWVGANTIFAKLGPDGSVSIFNETGSVEVIVDVVGWLPSSVVAADDAATVGQDAPATTIDVLANDTDPAGGPKLIASVTQPANGTTAIVGSGSALSYRPDPGYCNNPPGSSPDIFTYTLVGGASATVAVTVDCVDDLPVAVDDSATVAEDASATAINVLANDIDVDGGPMQVVSVTQPVGGTVVITGGGTGLTYEPDANVCNNPPGTTLDTFTYTLNGGSTATVSVTVDCVDDLPVAVDDSATVAEDASATAINVLANDIDVDGGPMQVVSVTQPVGGTVVITGGGTGLTYEPDANACNNPPGTTPDTFTYTLNGGSTATVSVTVTCSNDAPSVPPPTYASVANMKLSVPSATGLLAGASDPDGSTTLSIANVSATTPTGGTVALVGTAGAFDVTGPPGFAGALTFTYQVCDDGIPPPSACSGPITATVNINGPVVWFVDPAAATSGDGRLGSPFKTLAEAQAAIGTNNGQGVYLAAGTSPSGITLRPQGKLVGQGATGSTFDQFFALTVPSGVQTRPTLGTGTATAGGPIVLATDAFVRGIAVNTTSGGVSGSSATGVDVAQTSIASTNGPALDLSSVGGSVSISSLTQTAGATAVNVVDSAAAVTLSGGAISGTTGTAINLSGGAGSFTAANAVTVATGRAVAVQNRAAASTASFSGAITATGGTGILSASNNATASVAFTGALTLSTGANTAFDATSGVITSTSLTSSLTTTTGTALRVSGASIGAAGLTFRSVSANGAASGIVLANTGTAGSVTVTGSGTVDSGGTISNTTGPGISLTNTKSPSFAWMKIQTTAGSGISGSTVNGLSFTNGTITGSGSVAATGTSNIALSELTGAVTITGNTLTTAAWHGIDIANTNTNTTISSATITGNTITSATDGNVSKGSGIRITLTGGAGGAPTLAAATLSTNTITNFPSGAGIRVLGEQGQPNPTVVVGSDSNPITISGNTISGASPTNRMGTHAIEATVDGKATGAFSILNNPVLSHTAGNTISLAGNGQSTTRYDVTGNIIVANNLLGAVGIGLGTGPRFLATDAPVVNAVISNNTISATDGNGILAVAREAAGQLNVKIQNNNVSAPLTGVRPGIRVDSGSASSTGDKVCLNISGNTTAGSGGTPGIGLRRQESPSGLFAVNAMAATSTPGVEQYVAGLNSGSALGDPAFGAFRAYLISATTGFSGCSLQ